MFQRLVTTCFAISKKIIKQVVLIWTFHPYLLRVFIWRHGQPNIFQCHKFQVSNFNFVRGCLRQKNSPRYEYHAVMGTWFHIVFAWCPRDLHVGMDWRNLRMPNPFQSTPKRVGFLRLHDIVGRFAYRNKNSRSCRETGVNSRRYDSIWYETFCWWQNHKRELGKKLAPAWKSPRCHVNTP